MTSLGKFLTGVNNTGKGSLTVLPGINPGNIRLPQSEK
jgi:hypothetical protein